MEVVEEQRFCGISIVEAEKDNQMYFDYMGKDYWKQLPPGHSHQQGGNSGVRQESPRQQEKPDVILPMINNRTADKGHIVLYDQKEYERRVNDIVKGQLLVDLVGNTMNMLGQQQNLLSGIPLDAMRNNSNKLVNQDISIEPLEESNKKADSHLSRLVSRMEWFPVKYHLVDKVALVVFTVLGYYTGKYHLNDDLVFLWLVAGMPILIMTVIWGIDELCGWINGK